MAATVFLNSLKVIKWIQPVFVFWWVTETPWSVHWMRHTVTMKNLSDNISWWHQSRRNTQSKKYTNFHDTELHPMLLCWQVSSLLSPFIACVNIFRFCFVFCIVKPNKNISLRSISCDFIADILYFIISFLYWDKVQFHYNDMFKRKLMKVYTIYCKRSNYPQHLHLFI